MREGDHVWADAAQGKHTKEDAKEDRDDVSGLIFSVVCVVPKALIDPDGANEEGISVSKVDGEEEDAERDASLDGGRDSNVVELFHVAHVVINLKLLHAEGNYDTDSLDSLIRKGSALCERGRLSDVFDCHALNQGHDTNDEDGAENEHGQGQAPALDKTEAQARESHTNAVKELTVFMSDASFDSLGFLLNSGGKLSVVDSVIPSAILLKNGSHVCNFDASCDQETAFGQGEVLEVGADHDETRQAEHDGDKPEHFVKLFFFRDIVSREAIEDVSHHKEERWYDASVEERKRPADSQTASFARRCEAHQLFQGYNLLVGPSGCLGGCFRNLYLAINLTDEDLVRGFRLQVRLRLVILV